MLNKIKLVFVIGTDIRTWRGVEKVLFNYLRYAPNDFDIKVLETDFLPNQRISDEELKNYIPTDVEFLKLTLPDSFIIHKLRYSKKKALSFLRRLLFDLYLPKKDYKYLLKQKEIYNKIRNADIAYLFVNRYSIFFKGLKTKVIGSNHTWSPEFVLGKQNFILKLINRRFYNYFFKYIQGFHFFPNNYNYKNFLNKKFNIVLSNGVDSDKYDFNKPYSEGLNFLFVGSISKDKGVDILLEAWSMIKNKDNAKLHIVGTGPFDNFVKSKSLEDKSIIYHGVLSEKDLSKVYSQSDVFVYPSHSDTFALVVLEAAASGNYILCSDYLKGVFDDLESRGYLKYVDRSILTFKEEIENIINNKKVKIDREEEHDFVKQKYDWKVICSQLYNFFRSTYSS